MLHQLRPSALPERFQGPNGIIHKLPWLIGLKQAPLHIECLSS